jgi:hypothetical protein
MKKLFLFLILFCSVSFSQLTKPTVSSSIKYEWVGKIYFIDEETANIDTIFSNFPVGDITSESVGAGRVNINSIVGFTPGKTMVQISPLFTTNIKNLQVVTIMDVNQIVIINYNLVSSGEGASVSWDTAAGSENGPIFLVHIVVYK